MKNIFLIFISIFSLAFAARASDVPPTFTISAVGDIMMGTTYPSNRLPQDSGASYFREASRYLQASDIRFGNFEGTFFSGPTQPDGKAGGPNRYLFQTPVEYVNRLTDAGFNVVSLANNHAKDFGQAGLTSTKSTLTRAGIQFSSKDGEVAEFNINGISVALIATDFKPGPRDITQPSSIFTEIRRLKQLYQVVIVSAHVGAEGVGAERTPDREEIFLGEDRGNSVAFSHGCIEAGADVLIMHGPHVPRGLEVYRDRIVIYSLGNFATGAGISLGGLASVAPLVRVQIGADGRFMRGQVFSFMQVREQGTILDPQKRAQTLMQSLSQRDFPSTAPQFKDNGGFSAAN